MTKENNNKNNQNSDLNSRRSNLQQQLSKYELAKKKAAQEEEKQGQGAAKSVIAMGFRLSADFLSAVIVGGVIGLCLDKVFNISPWGLVVFLLLGFAAGVLNILRSLGKPIPFEKEEAHDKQPK